MLKIDLMPAWGKSWDDGACGEVAGILISYSTSSINSLRFIYFKDGSYKLSEDHHGQLSGSSQMIRLEYPTEFLTQVHGWRSSAVSSITFVTNKSTYGPFGKTNPAPGDSDFKFRWGSGGDSIYGFHGTISGSYSIGSIGIYLKISTPVSRPDLKALHL